MKINHISSPDNKDIDFLTQQINEETPERKGAFPFAFFIHDDNGNIIAGCNGSVIFGSIYTDQLWVHRNYRHQGLGQKLMEQAHEYGRQNMCRMATVATMSFQNARVFYEQLGYICDFERQGYSDGASCVFLRKEL